MEQITDIFSWHLARDAADLQEAQRLRYEVFVRELGGAGAGVDHAQGLETDAFDAFADHILVRNSETGELVGATRLLRDGQAQEAGGFYSESEFDLGPLRASGRRLLEIGRSCVRADVRGGSAMLHLWNGIASYVQSHACDLLFGVASLKGTDTDALAGPLSLLHHRHRAEPELRPVSRAYQAMDLIAEDALDRKAAMLALPALIKGYLRLGGRVGDGAFVDQAFNCIDVCMIMDTGMLNESRVRLYQGAGAV